MLTPGAEVGVDATQIIWLQVGGEGLEWIMDEMMCHQRILQKIQLWNLILSYMDC